MSPAKFCWLIEKWRKLIKIKVFDLSFAKIPLKEEKRTGHRKIFNFKVSKVEEVSHKMIVLEAFLKDILHEMFVFCL